MEVLRCLLVLWQTSFHSLRCLSLHSSLNKPKKRKAMTLKRVQNCLQVTLEKKRFLDLSHKQLSVVPVCLQKLCDIDELNLSANEIKVIPNFIIEFRSISVLDLHSNYVSTAEQPSGGPTAILTCFVLFLPAGAAPCCHLSAEEPASIEPVQQPPDQPPRRVWPADQTAHAQPGSQPDRIPPPLLRLSESAAANQPRRQPFHPLPRLPQQAKDA